MNIAVHSNRKSHFRRAIRNITLTC